MRLRNAKTEELEQISRLLDQAGLPMLDSGFPLRNLFVATEGPTVIGAIALGVHARAGMVRSLVVAPDQRGQGMARQLMQTLFSRSHELGLRGLYLLTTDGESVFEKLGFRRVPRDSAPPEIRSSRQFSQECPESALLMHRSLEES
jgi:N-acetylglutamate synthase-like GNAT family acetyltransferase